MAQKTNKLERILAAPKKAIAYTVLGLSLALSPNYGCGEENKKTEAQCTSNPIYIGPDSTYGNYPVTYNITSDPDQVVPSDYETGSWNAEVLRLGSDANIRIKIKDEDNYTVIRSHNYARDTVTGEFSDTWNPVEGFQDFELAINGNLSKDPETNEWALNMNVVEKGIDFYYDWPYTIDYTITGTKTKPDTSGRCVVENVPDTLYGIYAIDFNVTEDTTNLVTEEEKAGQADMPIYTLGNNAYIRVPLFTNRDHLRDLATGEIKNLASGELCDSWEDPTLGSILIYKVCGTLSDNGVLDLTGELNVNSTNITGHTIYKVHGTRK